MRRLTDNELIARLRTRAQELGRSPRSHEVRGRDTISQRFGGWSAALVAAGLQPYHLGRDGLLQRLVDKAEELGRTPSEQELRNDPAMPHPRAYWRRFGGLRAACAEVGLDTSHLPAVPGTFASKLDCHLQRKYGISEAEYWQMHDEQGGVCAICKQPEAAHNGHGRPRLSVDHCHETDRVRGLLCARCNQALGLCRESPETLRAMAAYLARHDIVAGV